MCGKNLTSYKDKGNIAGSPPRVREKLNYVDSVEPWTGITPACAGKTWQGNDTHNLDRDHPRVCGKNLVA